MFYMFSGGITVVPIAIKWFNAPPNEPFYDCCWLQNSQRRPVFECSRAVGKLGVAGGHNSPHRFVKAKTFYSIGLLFLVVLPDFQGFRRQWVVARSSFYFIFLPPLLPLQSTRELSHEELSTKNRTKLRAEKQWRRTLVSNFQNPPKISQPDVISQFFSC